MRNRLHARAGAVVVERGAAGVGDSIGDDLKAPVIAGEIALEVDVLAREVDRALKDRCGIAVHPIGGGGLCAIAEEQQSCVDLSAKGYGSCSLRRPRRHDSARRSGKSVLSIWAIQQIVGSLSKCFQ
jgi:hypothetical protein